MIFRGEFADATDERVMVEIFTTEGEGEREIGSGGLYFAASEAFTTESGYNDQFDILERQSGTLRLVTSEFIPELYGRGWGDGRIVVSRDGATLWRGFVEPRVYSQGYVETEEDLDVECMDCLGALALVKWDEAAGERCRAVMTLGEIIDTCLNMVGQDEMAILYDGSRMLDPGRELPESVTLGCSLFMGDEDDEDSVWTLEEVLTEVLRYLNLRVCQVGDSFVIHSPSSCWGASLGQGIGIMLSDENIWGADATLDVEEMWNRVSLLCEGDHREVLVENPLDSDSCRSLYGGEQPWVSEFSAWHSMDFYNIINNKGWDPIYEGKRVDYFISIMNHPRWKFGGIQAGSHISDIYGTMFQPGIDSQTESFSSLNGAALVRLRKGETAYDPKDNGIEGDSSTADYLVVTTDYVYNVPADLNTIDGNLMKTAPVAVYSGDTVNLSPSAGEGKRYLVISGSVLYSPVHRASEAKGLKGFLPENPTPPDYVAMIAKTDSFSEGYTENKDVKKETGTYGGEKRFFARQYWTTEDRLPWGKVTEWSPKVTEWSYLLPPPEEDDYFRNYKYEYSNSLNGAETDRVRMVPVLACMLIVGKKCLVAKPQKPSDSSWSGYGMKNLLEYEWRPYKKPEECASNKEYYEQTFPICIDPAIGDFMIGEEHDVANTIHYSEGLDTVGQKIPLDSEGLSGKLEFRIIGACNVIWEHVVKHSGGLFHSTRYSSEFEPLLARSSAIWIKDFEIRIVSDNARRELHDDDLVYVSDEDVSFENRHEEQTRIMSALTREERDELDTDDFVSDGIPTDLTTGMGLLSIYDRDRDMQGKPERLYVDWHYRLASRKRLALEATVRYPYGSWLRAATVRHPALEGKEFAVVGISEDFQQGTARLRLSEI